SPPDARVRGAQSRSNLCILEAVVLQQGFVAPFAFRRNLPEPPFLLSDWSRRGDALEFVARVARGQRSISVRVHVAAQHGALSVSVEPLESPTTDAVHRWRTVV